jgi:antitoxin component of RelBE/YafQ-DinJ toxin-antitoxin module
VQDVSLTFDASVPNKTTAREIKNARKGKGIVICKNAQDLFNKLGI